MLRAVITLLAVALGSPSMATIPAGTYRPLVPVSPEKTTVPVAAFRIDRLPVTNGDFLEFTREHPEWTKDRVSSIFAETDYLAHWPSADADQPVVNVSWFAARAYCVARGKRLPTEAEWERVAAASRTAADGSTDAKWRTELVALYSRPAPGSLPHVGSVPNFFGVSDLHGVVWEWVSDFTNASTAFQSGSDKLRFCGATAASATDATDFPAFARLALRSSLRASFTLKNLGFRCAADAIVERKP